METQKGVVSANEKQYDNLKQKLSVQKDEHEKLKQKVQAAKEAYEASAEATGKNSEESQKLKAEYEKLEARLTSSERAIGKTETAIEKQEAAVTQSKAALAEMEVQLRDVNAELARQKFDEYAEKAGKVGKAVEDVGKKMMVVTGAVAAVGVAAVKTTAEFDANMSQVAAVSGATGEDLDSLRDKAREMGEKTKFSASEAAQAMNYMAMAGWKTEDMLDGLDGVMNLAAASGEDLATTSDIVTDALTAFGLTAKDSGHFADILAAASSNANTNVSMMGETFKYCAPIAGALGFSAEDTAEAIGLMANAGIKSSQAGTALRTIMNNLAGEVTICGDAIGEVQIATTNADGSMRELSDILADCRTAFSGLTESEKAAAAESLVGKNAMSGFLALMNAGEADIEKLSTAIANCDGTAEGMAETMQDNLQGQITILMSQLQELAISFGEILMPTIRDIVSKVQEFVDKLNNMDDEQKKNIIRVGAFVAALGPLLVGIGKAITFTANVSKAMGTLSAAFVKVGGMAGIAGKATSALSGVLGFITSPIGIAVAAIAVIVGAFVTLWKTNEEFRNKVTAIWNKVKETFASFGNGIVERLNSLGFSFSSVTEVIKAVWTEFCNFLAPIFEGVFNYIAIVIDTVLNTIMGVVDLFIALVKRDWEGCWDAVKNIFETIWNGMSQWFSNILTTLRGVADVFLGWFGTSWDAVWNSVKTFFENIWNGIVTFFTNIWNTIVTAVTTAWETIKNVVQVGIMFVVELINAAFQLITLPFRFIWENCKETLISIWETMKTAVSTAITAVQTTITTILTAVGTFFSTKWNEIKTTVTTVWNAISTTVSTVINAIKATITTVFNAVKTTVTTVWNGIKTTATTVWNGIKTAIQTPINAAKTAISTAMNAIKTTVSNIWNGIKSTTTSTWNAIKNAIMTPINAAKTAVSNAINSIKSKFNFSWSLPKLKLPHVSISGKFSINPPSVPHFGISWYRDGGIMTRPTVFGMNGNKLLAGGEAGAEAILPLAHFYSELGNMIDRKLDAVAQENVTYVYVTLDGDEISTKTATRVERKIVKDILKKR
ncbi:MAG: phage tail tape measure protein [Tyzzerella sp.]|nr:phage tail tape measure protein [Tyzzerella sp.]